MRYDGTNRYNWYTLCPFAIAVDTKRSTQIGLWSKLSIAECAEDCVLHFSTTSWTRVDVMLKRLKQFIQDESGPTAVEYAVILALIVASIMTAVNTLATQTAASYNNSASQLSGVLGS